MKYFFHFLMFLTFETFISDDLKIHVKSRLAKITSIC